MKKRLNILCGLVFLAIFISLMDGVIDGARGFYKGYTSVPDEGMPRVESKNAYGLSVRHNIMQSTCDSVRNAKNGEFVPVEYGVISVSVDSYYGPGYLILQFVLACLIFFAFLVAFIAFVRFIRNVNREKIFHWDNVRLLRYIGWCFLGAYVANTIFMGMMYWETSQVFELENYTLNYSAILSDKMLFEGAIALIAAEVFAIGLRLQEEQELTI